MKRKFIFFLVTMAAPLMALTGCNSQTERTEWEESEIEAAQMEGKRAAEHVAAFQGTDTLELQRRVLKAHAMKSEYDMAGKRHCSEAFDSVFTATLKQRHPALASQMGL